MQVEIGSKAFIAEYQEGRPEAVEGQDNCPINISVGGDGSTEDWAAIGIDASKVNANNFKGNAIDLGTRISPDEFTRMIYSNPRNFKYPCDPLLRFKGTILDEQMRCPTSFDRNGDPCLIMIKRGNAGLTVGRINNICSYVHSYYNDDNAKISKEWAIFPRDSESGIFPVDSNSGSVIVDGVGRIGGLLTGGANATPSSDITYATPLASSSSVCKKRSLQAPRQSDPHCLNSFIYYPNPESEKQLVVKSHEILSSQHNDCSVPLQKL